MRYPFGLVYDSAKHLLAGKLRRDAKFAISMTIDPLGGCTHSCCARNAPKTGMAAPRCKGAETRPMLSVEAVPGRGGGMRSAGGSDQRGRTAGISGDYRG